VLYIYNIFLFIKFVVACFLNGIYICFWDNHYRFKHTMQILKLYLLLPMVCHLIISKWEVTLYLALPVNLAAVIWHLDNSPDAMRSLRPIRNTILLSILICCLFWSISLIQEVYNIGIFYKCLAKQQSVAQAICNE
jgi:fructose-specific phosphotransferase system IIC component